MAAARHLSDLSEPITPFIDHPLMLIASDGLSVRLLSAALLCAALRDTRVASRVACVACVLCLLLANRCGKRAHMTCDV